MTNVGSVADSWKKKQDLNEKIPLNFVRSENEEHHKTAFVWLAEFSITGK